MRVLSLFSGIGGFDLGLERAGMIVGGQVEIDPYCQRVLSRHWPDTWRASDVRGVGSVGESARRDATHADLAATDDGRRQAGAGLPGGIDIIVGGFPCQDVSVAGQRAGLHGARSGLWFEFQRILFELRPRWALIENVPGLLSSNQGRDFGIILDGLGECGFSGISWAVLDSQYFGVAQRRRRVFIVCGPTRRATEQVLSLCESCGGHPAKGRAAGEGAAATIRGGVANPRGSHAGSSGGQRYDLDNETYVPEVVPNAISAKSAKGAGGPAGDEILNLVAIRAARTSANGHGIAEDVAHTLDGANGQAVAWAIQERAVEGEGASGPDGIGVREGTAYTLEARPKVQMAAYGAAVRRLTPTECERLQGFPDGWTDGADGPRYRALGNAVTVPVIEYIGRRIMAWRE